MVFSVLRHKLSHFFVHHLILASLLDHDKQYHLFVKILELRIFSLLNDLLDATLFVFAEEDQPMLALVNYVSDSQ